MTALVDEIEYNHYVDDELSITNWLQKLSIEAGTQRYRHNDEESFIAAMRGKGWRITYPNTFLSIYWDPFQERRVQ